MADPKGSYVIEAVQASPVFLDRDATVDKACGLIVQTGRNGARLVLFPKSFVPAYPDWAWAVHPAQDGIVSAPYSDLLWNAVEIPGGTTLRRGEAAGDAGAFVAMGVTDRNSEASGASLFNTRVYLDPNGSMTCPQYLYHLLY